MRTPRVLPERRARGDVKGMQKGESEAYQEEIPPHQTKAATINREQRDGYQNVQVSKVRR